MDQYIHGGCENDLDLGRTTDEAPSYAGNHSSGAPSGGLFNVSPWEFPMNGTYFHESGPEYNFGFEKGFDHGSPASTDDDEHFRVQHNIEHSDDEDVCQQCSSFPWKGMSHTREFKSKSKVDIDMSKHQLTPSYCRICRFIARIIEAQDLPWVESYRLEASTAQATANGVMTGLLILDQSDIIQTPHIRSLNNRVRKTVPHLVVANAPFEDKSIEKRYYQVNRINFDHIKSWIQDCHMTHSEDCIGDAQHSLRQLRVIDCGSRTVVPAPRLCHYVALSYVWGQHNGAFDDLQNPPKTIADSIYLAQMLGYQYLWIDRFCIDQNDRIDKHRQVKQMGDIYSAAQVTFVAAAGSDPSYGLPGVLSRPRPVPEAERVGNIWLRPLPRLIRLAEVAESKWASRAWTFQEFYRSRRRLVFTENQVIFVCNSQIRYEIGLSGIDWSESYGLSKDDAYWARRWLPHYGVAKDQRSMWTAIDWTAIDRAAGHLQAYSNRDLTFDSDSLDAIAGALDSLRKNSVYHVWGALFRQAVGHTGDSHSAKLRHCECSVCRNGRPFLFRFMQSATEHDIHLEPVPPPGSQDFQQMNNLPVHPKADQHAISEYPQQFEIALTWFHQKQGRRRPGFPSWSSLGWKGPINWYRRPFDDEESPIVLSDARRARLHYPKFSCDLSNFDPAQQESIDSTPPTLELLLRIARLDLVLDGNQSRVALKMSCRYKYVLRVDWDADPTSMDAKQLVGALLEGRAGEQLEGCALVLASYRGVLERVGLMYLPGSSLSLRVYDMRQHNLMPLAGLAVRRMAEVLCGGYSPDYGAWWRDVFSNYRPIMIG